MRFLTSESPSVVFPMLGIALASMLFLFTFTVTDANLRQGGIAMQPLTEQVQLFGQIVGQAVDRQVADANILWLGIEEAVYATAVAAGYIPFEKSIYYSVLDKELPASQYLAIASGQVAGAYAEIKRHPREVSEIRSPVDLFYNWLSGR